MTEQEGPAEPHGSAASANALDLGVARECWQQADALIDQFAKNGDEELLDQAARRFVDLAPVRSLERHNVCS